MNVKFCLTEIDNSFSSIVDAPLGHISTDMQEKMKARLRDSRFLASSVLTQLSHHLFLHIYVLES